MNRLSFRPRPLDVYKKLPIVRSMKEVDAELSAVSRTVHHGHIALDAENEEVLPVPSKKGIASEIPIPNFHESPSYAQLYPATFEQPMAYVRSTEVADAEVSFVEYDLDDDDEAWLAELNKTRVLLEPSRFERLLHRLELLDARLRTKAGMGGAVADATGGTPGLYAPLGSRVPVFVQLNAAREELQAEVPRQSLLRAVFDYWRSKRELWGKPILRRLQPPPSVTDPNPYHVFRPREKAHRPHTRRMQRRENDMASFEKMLQIQGSVEEAAQIANAVIRREETKLDLARCEVALQRAGFLKEDLTVAEAEDLGILPRQSGGSSRLRIKTSPAGDASALSRLLLSRLRGAELRAALHASVAGQRSGGREGFASPRWLCTASPAASRSVAPSTPLHASAGGPWDLEEEVAGGGGKRRRTLAAVRRGAGDEQATTASAADCLQQLLAEGVCPAWTRIDAGFLEAAGVLVPRLPVQRKEGGAVGQGKERGEMLAARMGRCGRLVFDRWDVLENVHISESTRDGQHVSRSDEFHGTQLKAR